MFKIPQSNGWREWQRSIIVKIVYCHLSPQVSIMPISFSCPGCRRPYNVQDQMAGQGVKCACGAQFVVPRPAAPANASGRPQ